MLSAVVPGSAGRSMGMIGILCWAPRDTSSVLLWGEAAGVVMR